METRAQLTTFIGRQKESSELIELIEEYPLVTVTGHGGVGKTRLAVEAAQLMADRFVDGIVFVELDSVTDGARVAHEVATALGIPQIPGAATADILARALTARRLLLVLDNCEQVLLATASLCAAILNKADDVRILVTSREQLGIREEVRYRLFPLSLPDPGLCGSVPGSEAVALFVDRARRVDPHFSLNPQTDPLVAHVVRRLGGVPLAIELAAARIDALGMAGLAARIDDALRLLVGADPLAVNRHRSLAAVADWSYQLLSPVEQQTFRRLALFVSPCTLEAAEAVAGAGAGPIILRLVGCSLLTPPRMGPDNRPRYGTLWVLHQYAREQLAASGEEFDTAEAVARYALSVAEEAHAGLLTHDRELAAINWLTAEAGTL